MTEPSQQDFELLRAAIRAYVVQRRPAAFAVPGIQNALTNRAMVDFPITAEQVARECDLLEGLGHLTHHTNELGSTKFYSATAAGILAHERAR